MLLNSVFISYNRKILVVNKKLKPFPRNLLGSKITYKCMWRDRETDEGSEYFLHTWVPMGYTRLHRHAVFGTHGGGATHYLLNPEEGSRRMRMAGRKEEETNEETKRERGGGDTIYFVPTFSFLYFLCLFARLHLVIEGVYRNISIILLNGLIDKRIEVY